MLWYLAFTDDAASGKARLLGVCFVEAADFSEAVQRSHRAGCNPGGRVHGLKIGGEALCATDTLIPPEDLRGSKNGLIMAKLARAAIEGVEIDPAAPSFETALRLLGLKVETFGHTENAIDGFVLTDRRIDGRVTFDEISMRAVDSGKPGDEARIEIGGGPKKGKPLCRCGHRWTSHKPVAWDSTKSCKVSNTRPSIAGTHRSSRCDCRRYRRKPEIPESGPAAEEDARARALSLIASAPLRAMCRRCGPLVPCICRCGHAATYHGGTIEDLDRGLRCIFVEARGSKGIACDCSRFEPVEHAGPGD